MLGRLQQTGTSKVCYADAEPALTELLRNFGPPDRKTSPAYPFHDLQSDGIWTVDSPAGNDLGASRTQLRGSGATGQLPTKFEAALRKDALLVAMAAAFCSTPTSPSRCTATSAQSSGWTWKRWRCGPARQRAASLRRRDPQFRDAVLVAYEYRCAMCSNDGRLGTEAVGLDAAHVRWWVFDGPDSVDNALCLCSFHHKLLDRGVVGIADDYTVSVSARFVGRGRAAEVLVLDLLGRPLQAPQRGQPLPGLEHVQWHRSQVFSSPARIPAI